MFGLGFCLEGGQGCLDLGAQFAGEGQIETVNGQANARKGYIRESQARDFEAAINAVLRPLEGVDTSDAPTVTMRRDEDILATGTVTFAFRATPYGYARQIVSSFGFSNPRNG